MLWFQCMLRNRFSYTFHFDSLVFFSFLAVTRGVVYIYICMGLRPRPPGRSLLIKFLFSFCFMTRFCLMTRGSQQYLLLCSTSHC